jgi:hypothetical protein
MSINATDVPMIGERGSSSCARVISLLLSSIYQRQYIESARRLPGVAPLSPLQIQALDLFDELANDPVLNLMVGAPARVVCLKFTRAVQFGYANKGVQDLIFLRSATPKKITTHFWTVCKYKKRRHLRVSPPTTEPGR